VKAAPRSGTEEPVKVLDPLLDSTSDTRRWLAHARQQAIDLGLDRYFVVDVDSHREPNVHWDEVIAYMDNGVMRANSREWLERTGRPLYVPEPFPGGTGYEFQTMHGRIRYSHSREEVADAGIHRDVELCRRAMDSIGIDVQVVFPTTLLSLGTAPLAQGEAQVAYAYNRWMVERFCSEDPRITFLPYLPFRDPEMALRIVREFIGKPGVVGFLVASIRFDPVHANAFMPIYAELEAAGYPLAFHAGPCWDDEWMRTMNRFVSVHALSFVHCNLVHLTNWIINGLPERFPGLNVIWVESGLAWVPFIMQRLDHEYLKRTSEAPLLTRLPSEYIREMYFTSQPMERDNLELLQATMTAIGAATQVLYASDWPHWDFDLPSALLELPFLGEQAKRNILGLNAARVFRLDVPDRYQTPAGA